MSRPLERAREGERYVRAGNVAPRFPGISTCTLNPSVGRGTRTMGIHIGELRHAIDAVRRAAGYPPAWSSYAAATGPVTASDIVTARQKLDEAVVPLLNHGVTYTGEAPAMNAKIWAYQMQQIRDGVR